MRSVFLIQTFAVILVGLSLSVVGVGREMSQTAADAFAITSNRPPASKFTCLPKNVQLDEVITGGRGGQPAITVERQLVEMKARCRNGRLVDAKRREIRFFRPSCWGNPPPDYLEIQTRENEELAKLKRRYRVIIFRCSPMIQ